MRHLWIAAAIVALVGIGSCSTQLIPKTPAPVVTQGLAARVLNAPAIDRYIYVADRTAQKLLVYRAGVANPNPIRSVAFTTAPIGVACDSHGRVYVSLWASSQVEVFSAGASRLLYTLNASNGLNEPSGVAIDGRDDLWVANRGNPSYVAEYAPGGKLLGTRVDIPANFVAGGIAFAPNQDLWVDIMAEGGGFVIRYPAPDYGNYDHQHIIGTAGLGGVAFDARGDLNIGTIGSLLTFAPPNWKRAGMAYFGEGAHIGLATADAAGTLYLPVSSTLGKPEVMVVPSGSLAAPYRITNGLSQPSGAAAGV